MQFIYRRKKQIKNNFFENLSYTYESSKIFMIKQFKLKNIYFRKEFFLLYIIRNKIKVFVSKYLYSTLIYSILRNKSE